MSIHQIADSEKNLYDSLVSHPLQSWAWGEFREKLGQKVIRLGKFDGEKMVWAGQFFIHKIPHVAFSIGYCPRSLLPDKEIISEIKKIAHENKCIFVKFEPNVLSEDARCQIFSFGVPNPSERVGASVGSKPPASSADRHCKICQLRIFFKQMGIIPAKALFTPYTFQIDLTQTEEELLKNMHPKTRYNINLARKKGVVIEEDNSDEAFETFQKLTEETTKRQKFFAHNRKYRKLMWKTMRDAGVAHLLTASRKSLIVNRNSQILSTWIIFIFNGVGYYPYGASSREHKELMASNLLAWETLLLAKKNGCQKFDFWGALGPAPIKNDPWYGFHRFKEGYGGKLVEFIGTYDLVINPLLYKIYNLADEVRWLILHHI